MSEERFIFRAFDEISIQTRRAYLVKGIIPREGQALIWGPPKCGKSFLTADLMLHVAHGWEYRGRRVIAGPVMYCAFEGGSGYGQRIAAFRKAHSLANDASAPFYLLAAQVDLIRDVDALVSAIERRLGGERPVAVVLDTLNRSLVGSESDDRDMAAYRSAADKIQFTFGCVVVMVHHCGVDERRPRGHTSLTGAVDSQISVKRDGSGNIVATLEYMKDGPEGDVFTSRLETVEVGMDEDGEPITSCVVRPVAGETGKTAPTRRLPDRQKLAVDALADALNRRGELAPAIFGLPADTTAVTVPEWREEMFARGVLDRDAKNPREDFRRIKASLQARLLIAEREGRVWLVRP